MSRAIANLCSSKTVKSVLNRTPVLSTLNLTESNSTHLDGMFRTVKIHFNKKHQQQTAEFELSSSSSTRTTTTSPAGLAETSLQSLTSLTSSAIAVESKPSKIIRAMRVFNIMRSSFCARVFQTLRSFLSVIGGVYAIHQLINTYIIQHEERMEVLVIRRS